MKPLLLATVILIAGCNGSTYADNNESSANAAPTTLGTAQAFLEAAGMGDMDKLNALMRDDFVWHNEGDSSIPWIGTWEGKQKVLQEFLPAFGAGLKTTSWTTDYSFAKGEHAVFIGTMSADANNTGKSTGSFSWAVRVHVIDGKVKSWNWFEDSYAVSQAYHGK